MGLMQRNKGKVFERKIATALREWWPDVVVRRASQADRAYQSDVYVTGGPVALERIWWECQDARTPTPIAKLEQAERDIALASVHELGSERLPVVVWHKLGAHDVNVTTRLWVVDEVRGVNVLSGDCAIDQAVVTISLDEFLAMANAVQFKRKEAA